MQGASISAVELQAWVAGTMTDFGPRDFQDTLTLSRIFVGAFNDYSGKNIDPPWSPPMTKEEEVEFNKAQERMFDVLFGVNDGVR